ncbi:MAG: hypothetical protein VCC00_13810 [Deltaproteobacteria bacterium]
MIKGKWNYALAAIAALGMAMPSAALAGIPGKYQVTFVPQSPALNALIDIQMPADRAGKLKLKQNGSDKDGTGGFVMQIAGNGKLICASNPDSKGLCGPKDNMTEAISQTTWTVLGAVEITNAARLWVKGGKIVFQATGKNKGDANGNAAASTIYDTSVQTGYASINDMGSDPDNEVTGCDAGPTADKTTCANSFASVVAGFMFGHDDSLGCSVDEDCNADVSTLVCVAGACAVQTCTVPSDCNSGACNMGSGPSGGTCCDIVTSTDPDCTAASSPSGAFLDSVNF